MVDKTNTEGKFTSETVKEILPKAGLVYSEKAALSEVLCKPKILPLKSATLMKLEKMELEIKIDSQLAI